MTFGVFRNEYGNAEFAIQVVRDPKSMTWTPEKRLCPGNLKSQTSETPQLWLTN